MVRGDNVRSAKALLGRVNKIAEGAALMTETSFTSRQIDGTSDTVSNTVLEELIYKNLKAAPWQNVATGKSTIAHKGLLLAAKVLAATAADLMEQPELLAKAKEEFLEATELGYDCPIGKEVTF